MNKQGQLIKLNDSWIVYNEDEIKEGCFYLSKNNTIEKAIPVHNVGKIKTHVAPNVIAISYPTECLLLLDKKQIEEQIELFSYNVEEFILYEVQNDFKGFVNGYRKGFNKAIELNKDKMFTLDQMLDIAKYSYEFRANTQFPEHNFEDACINNTKQQIQYLQSLQQPKQYQVEYEEEIIKAKSGSFEHLFPKPKLTNGYLHVKIIK